MPPWCYGRLIALDGRFVCVTSVDHSGTSVFSSYYSRRRGTSMLNVVKITDAVRATSAASSFFDSVTIDGETFVDGATGANNPVRVLWQEAQDIWGLSGSSLDHHVSCLVSIGTGVPSPSAFGNDPLHIAKALVRMTLDTEREAEAFQREHTGLFRAKNAFRLNVSHGLETVGLEDLSQLGHIRAMTRRYFESESVSNMLEDCSIALQGHKCMYVLK